MALSFFAERDDPSFGRRFACQKLTINNNNNNAGLLLTLDDQYGNTIPWALYVDFVRYLIFVVMWVSSLSRCSSTFCFRLLAVNPSYYVMCVCLL